MIALMWIVCAGQTANTAWYATTRGALWWVDLINAVSLLACLLMSLAVTAHGQ